MVYRKRLFGIRMIAAAAAAVLGGLEAHAQQSLPWHEPFDYAVGNIVGQGGWTQTGTGTASPVQVSLPSLSYSGLPPASGGKIILRNGTNFQDVGRDISGQNSGSIYASFLLNVTNAGNTTGDYFFHFSSAGAGAQDFRSRVVIRQGSSAAKFQLGLSNISTDTPTWTAEEFDLGIPLFVVVAYTFSPDVNDDLASLWINPPLGLNTAPVPTITQAVLQDFTTLGRVGWRQGQGNSLLVLEVDELRVATTWSAVTPHDAPAHVGDWPLY